MLYFDFSNLYLADDLQGTCNKVNWQSIKKVLGTYTQRSLVTYRGTVTFTSLLNYDFSNLYLADDIQGTCNTVNWQPINKVLVTYTQRSLVTYRGTVTFTSESVVFWTDMTVCGLCSSDAWRW